MKIYVVSLAVGLLVGVLYGVLNVRSPAPPVVALVGLLGILLGEQIPALIRHNIAESPRLGWMHQVKPHVFGELPVAGGSSSGELRCPDKVWRVSSARENWISQASQRCRSGPGGKRSRITLRRYPLAVSLSMRHPPMSGPGCHSSISRQFVQNLNASGDGGLLSVAGRSAPISDGAHILCANPCAPHSTLATA
jgi:XapX domain-containing protein